MIKSTYLREIQKRLPDDIILQDETTFEFTEDELIGILSWIKYFKEHYKVHGERILPYIHTPLISKRIRLDFGLYISHSDQPEVNPESIIYIASNFTSKTNPTLHDLIRTWKL